MFRFNLQGTSRLISTDSEGINNSPPYLSPPQQFHLGTLATPSVSNAAAAAALVAVLSDDRIDEPIHQNLDQPQDSVPSPTNQKTKKTAEKAKPKPEPIKIKIKTKLTNAFIASLAEEKSNEVVGKKPRASRAAKKQLESVESGDPKSPQPGSAGYELYQTLTKSPTEDIDSQSSLIGSVGSTLATPAAPVESCVIQCRSSDATTDQDTSQDSSLVAPLSETDVRLAAAMKDVDLSQAVISNTHAEEEPVIQELATRRRGRPKATATVPKKRGNHKVALDAPTEVTVSPKRTNTRGKRGTNTVEEDTENLHSPPVAQASEPEIIPKKRRGVVEELVPESPEKVSKVGRPRRAAAAQATTEETVKEAEEPIVPVEEKLTKIARPSRNKTNGAMLQVRITKHISLLLFPIPN